MPTLAILDANVIKDTEGTTDADGIKNTKELVVQQAEKVQGNAGHPDTNTEKACVHVSGVLHVEDKGKVANPDRNQRLNHKRTAIGTARRPDSIYKKYQKLLKKRIFPCPSCGHAADGSHQCVVCFAHVHVICGTPVEDSCEGFGQLVYCNNCEPPKHDTSTPLHDTSDQIRLDQQTPQDDTSEKPPLEKPTPPRPCTEPDFNIPPSGIYSQPGPVWWERKFSCPRCGDPANGAHQCVRCFAHMHKTVE